MTDTSFNALPPLGPPPNYPDPVPYEWCFERQKRVVGPNWEASRSLVASSARELKEEIDFSREKMRTLMRAMTAPFDADMEGLRERLV